MVKRVSSSKSSAQLSDTSHYIESDINLLTTPENSIKTKTSKKTDIFSMPFHVTNGISHHAKNFSQLSTSIAINPTQFLTTNVPLCCESSTSQVPNQIPEIQQKKMMYVNKSKIVKPKTQNAKVKNLSNKQIETDQLKIQQFFETLPRTTPLVTYFDSFGESLMEQPNTLPIIKFKNVQQSNGVVDSATKEKKKRKRGICPTYKVVENTTFAVDAFRYGDIEGVTHYFLTHFHADHYVGLKKTFNKPLIMSTLTGKSFIIFF